MAAHREKLPYGISEYIRTQFREDFLFELTGIQEVGRHRYYTIAVTKDNYIHTLKFDEKGRLVTDSADETFPADSHEGPGFGEIPD